MRTFLTYVLAAVLAAIFLSLPTVFDRLGGVVPNDPRLVAGGSAAIAVNFTINLLVAFNIYGLIFAVLKALSARIGFRIQHLWNLPVALALFVIPPMLIVLFSRDTVTTESYPNHIPISDPGFLIAFASVIGAGLAWGTVFWLREPKTSQAMEAAA